MSARASPRKPAACTTRKPRRRASTARQAWTKLVPLAKKVSIFCLFPHCRKIKIRYFSETRPVHSRVSVMILAGSKNIHTPQFVQVCFFVLNDGEIKNIGARHRFI